MCADDAHGTPIMLTRRGRRGHPGSADRTHRGRTPVRLRRFHVSLRQLSTPRTRRRTGSCAEYIYNRLNEGGHIARRVINQAYDPRRPCSFRTAISGANAPCAGPRTSTATVAKLRLDLQSDGSRRTRSPRLRRDPGRTGVRALLLPPGDFEDMLKTWTQADQMQRQVAQQAQGMVRRRPAGLGHIARRALLRFRDSRRPGQVLLRLAGCADRISWPASGTCARRVTSSSTISGERIRRRAVPLHRQGYPLFPHAVLAGHADGAGFRKPTRVYAHGFLTVNGRRCRNHGARSSRRAPTSTT